MQDNHIVEAAEVEFWMHYIQHWKQRHSGEVPERAYEALAQARLNHSLSEKLVDSAQVLAEINTTIH